MQHTILILSLIVLGCNSQPSPSVSLAQDEYDVFSAVILFHVDASDRMVDTNYCVFIYRSIKRGILLGERKYSKYDPKRSSSDTSASLKYYSSTQNWDSLETNFKIVSLDTVGLDRDKFKVPYKVVLIYEQSFYRNSTKNMIGEFSFSRVGFNAERNEALLYYTIYDHGLSGRFTALLRKDNSKWHYIKSYGDFAHEWFIGYDYYPKWYKIKPNIIPMPDVKEFEKRTIKPLAVP